MRIVIVGAGIAGLTLAVALHHLGRDAVVLEQARSPHRSGTGAQLSPNAVRPLVRLGLGGALELVAVRPRRREVYWRDGSLLESVPMGEEYKARFNAPYYTLLRSDLHAALLARVAAGTVLTGHYVTDVLDGFDSVVLRCADGREVHGDVVIGADGVHSAVRGALEPEEHHPSELIVCRGLVSATRVPESGGPPRIRVWLGPGQQFVCYPVESGRSLSFKAILPSGHIQPGAWSERGRSGALRAAFTGWSGEVAELINTAGRISASTLHERDPLREWSRGRIALMGDSAHPMTPFFAQGATQAVEDAVVLARFLGRATWETVEESLRRYARVRRERVERVQGLLLLRLAWMRQAEDNGTADRSFLLEQERRESDWMYGYDAEAAADIL